MTCLHSRLLRALFGWALTLATLGCGDDEATGHGSRAGSAGQGDDAGAGGSGDSGSGGEGGDASGCTPIELGARQVLHYSAFAELLGVRIELAQGLGDPALPDYLLVELYDSTTPTESGFLPALESGEFELENAPDDQLATCQHCVSLALDVSEGTDALGAPLFQPAALYYARAGSMQLEEVHDPLNLGPENSLLQGSVKDVELAEVDLDDPMLSFLPDSDCFRIANAEFDSRPTPGADCEDLDDCGNELLEVCDPASLSCLDEVQCTIDQPCEGEAFCIVQNPLSFQGACYPSCTPFASGSCADGHSCVQYGLSEQLGYCLKSGQTEPGEACQNLDAVNSCAGDAVCLDTCVQQCGFFSGDPGCSSGSACDVLGHCLPAGDGDPASLGETCEEGAELASPCARNGERFDGICFTYFPAEPATCGKSCFVDENDYTDGNADDGADDLDCPADSFCALRFSSGLGICLPDPVCGDGDFGEVGEACDDGNTADGDGCSADCQTVEYGPLCAAAEELALDASVESTTKGGVDGFLASCQAGIARSRIYTVAPPGPGQLTLSIASDTIHVVSLRDDCPTAESELGCSDSFTGLTVQLTEAPAAPLSVLVSAWTVLEEGPFTLSAEFTPQVCGDGKVVGSEACDDANTADGDGCSADCLAIEYDYYCDNAESLTPGQTVSGELTPGLSLYDASCGYGTAPDKIYTLTAPRAGTLTVSLDQTVDPSGYLDLALFALDSCGPPDSVTELACSSVYDAEQLMLEVAKDQSVFFVVDGLGNTSGQYEISATLD